MRKKRAGSRRVAVFALLILGSLIALGTTWLVESRRANLTVEMFRLIRDEAPASEIKRLLEAGADPNAREPDEDAPNPLLERARTLWSGAPKVEPRKQDTVLSLAAYYGKPDVVHLLLAAGAKVNEPGRDGRTPLMAACSTRSVEVARLLLESGADPNAKDEGGYSVLYIGSLPYATGKPTYNWELINLLKKHGARE